MRSGEAEKILAGKKAAAQAVAAFRHQRDSATLTLPSLQDILYRYILSKYRIAADECPTRNLEALATASIAALMGAADDGYRGDTAATCDGADSVTVKQALLMVALQKDFQVELDAIAVAFAETTDDVAQLIWDGCQSRTPGSGESGPR